MAMIERESFKVTVTSHCWSGTLSELWFMKEIKDLCLPLSPFFLSLTFTLTVSNGAFFLSRSIRHYCTL